jgi:hypothetical protein
LTSPWEDVGFPPIDVFILDVVVIDGDVLLDCRGHVVEGIPPGRRESDERERWAGLFFYRSACRIL